MIFITTALIAIMLADYPSTHFHISHMTLTAAYYIPVFMWLGILRGAVLHSSSIEFRLKYNRETRARGLLITMLFLLCVLYVLNTIFLSILDRA